MHFDLLDEFGTLVPFGLGISKGNRVVQHPDIVGAGGGRRKPRTQADFDVGETSDDAPPSDPPGRYPVH